MIEKNLKYEIYVSLYNLFSNIWFMRTTCKSINKTFDTWSECVGHGGKLIVDFSIDMKEHADKNKLYVSYFCNEVKDVI